MPSTQTRELCDARRVPSLSTRAIAPLFARLPACHAAQRYAAMTSLPVTISDQIWRALEAHEGPLAGLRIASEVEPATYGLLTRIIAACPDVRRGLHCLQRYYPVLSGGTTHDLDVSATGIELTVDVRRPYPVDAIIEGFAMAVVVAFLRKQAQGSLRVKEVHLHARLSKTAVAGYAAFFGAPVHIEAPKARLILAREDASAALRGRDPELFDWLAERASRPGEHAPKGRGTATQVADLLRCNLGETLPALPELAATLGLSARTLRRHLDAEGTSLRTISDELRRQVAQQHLASGASVDTVARVLGFADRSAFRRAFRRWTGVAPGAFRGSLDPGRNDDPRRGVEAEAISASD